MKKLFLLIPAFLLSLAVSAATTAVSSGVNKLTTAITAASAGDILELGNGYFYENGDFDITKNLTIKAADGAHPIIANRYYFKVVGGADITFQGIKFDGASWRSGDDEPIGASDHCVRSHNNSTGEEDIQFIDCEFTNYKNYVIYTQRDTRRWNSITIRNCTFYNNKSCAVIIDEDGGEHTKQSCNSLTIENSTFANFTGANDVIYYNAPDAEHTTSLTMDHCTFYNHPKYAVNWQKSTNLTITNCIFAQPSTVSNKSVECVGGNITKCLSYKTGGYSSAATPTGNLTGNPYFVNTTPGSYDFSVASFSPAHNAGTDNKDLGDYLRWNSDDSAHPTTINLSAGTDAIKAAVAAAWPGDEIILAEGTYNESASIELDKNLTIKAADGASPAVKPVKEISISNGANITLQGIKFDGSSQEGISKYIYAADNSANNLTVEGCEFYNTSYPVIYAGSSAHLNACVINNCYFHNGTNSAVSFAITNQEYNACDDLTITNSTFANFSGFNAPVIAFYNKNETTNTPTIEDAKLVIDHCTFYNFVKTNLTYTYGFVDSRKSGNVVISNSIFAHPSSETKPYASYCYGGTVNNCLIYNTNGHRTDNMTINNSISADPLFTDAANGDFTFPGDYANDNVSPARNAGTDGTDLGDPRWYTPAIYPETDFASGYAFTAAKAKLNGNITLETNESAPTHPYIRYIHINATTGTAEWIIKATKACYVQATVNMVDNTWTTDPSDAEMFKNHKHIFVVEVRKANNTLVGSVKECEYNEDGSTDGIQTDVATNPNVILPGQIYIPEAGVYTIILRNPRNGSRCGVGSVTLAYAGGDIVPVAANANTTLNVADALFTEGFTRADGQVSPGSWKPEDPKPLGYVKWNIVTSETKFYDLTLNFSSDNAHSMAVNIYEDEEASPVATVSESYTSTTGTLTLSGRINLVGGKNYIVKVTNPTSGSHAKVTNIVFAPVVATSTALPNSLEFSNAVLSEKANITDGMLYFNVPGADKDPRGQWAQWEVTTNHNGLFLFTMGVTSESEQSYKITIKDNSENDLDYYETNPGSGDKTLKHYFALNAGTYFVKVENTFSYSKGHLTSLVVTEPAGVVTIDESATDNTAWVDKVVDKNAEGPLYDVQIIRTIKAGMYNTFCLPFAVSSDKAKDIFGSDVEIYTLDAAVVTDNVLYVTLKKASDIYQGTPVFIKPSRDIVNPVFNDVKFTVSAPESTTKANANFVGTFVQTTLEPDQNILFLGADNTLYYPAVSIPIKGMRGWFVVHDISGPAYSIRRMQIVNKSDAPTGINTVNENANPATKTIMNGKLIIIRDGDMYDIMGRRMAE